MYTHTKGIFSFISVSGMDLFGELFAVYSNNFNNVLFNVMLVRLHFRLILISSISNIFVQSVQKEYWLVDDIEGTNDPDLSSAQFL